MTEGYPTGTVINYDLLCFRCGYNLRGLMHDGNCPECGLPLAQSLKASRLGNARWVDRVSLGLGLLYAGPVAMLWGKPSPLNGLIDTPVMACCAALAGIGVLACIWLITCRNERWPENEQPAWRRWAARGVSIGIAAWQLTWAIRLVVAELNPLMYVSPWSSLRPPEWLHCLLAACLVAALWHPQRLAHWVAPQDVVREFRRLRGLLALSILPLGFLQATDFYGEVWPRLAAEQLNIGRFLFLLVWLRGLLLSGRLIQRLREFRGESAVAAVSSRALAASMKEAQFRRMWWSVPLLSAVTLLVLDAGYPPNEWSGWMLGPATYAAYIAGLVLLWTSLHSRGTSSAIGRFAAAAWVGGAAAFALAAWLTLTQRQLLPSRFQAGLLLWIPQCMLPLLLATAGVLGFEVLRRLCRMHDSGPLARSIALREVILPLSILVLLGIHFLPVSSITLASLRELGYRLSQLFIVAVYLECVTTLGRVWRLVETTADSQLPRAAVSSET